MASVASIHRPPRSMDPDHWTAKFTERGLPTDLFAAPLPLWQASPRAVLHAQRDCARLRGATPSAAHLTAAQAADRQRCSKCCNLFGYTAQLPNGVRWPTLRYLLTAWDEPRANFDRRSFLLSQAAAALLHDADHVAGIEATSALRELAAYISREAASVLDCKADSEVRFAATPQGRLAYAMSALFDVAGAATAAYNTHGPANDAQAHWSSFDESLRSVRYQMASGAITDIERLERELHSCVLAKFGQPPADTSTISLTGEFGRRVGEHLSELVRSGAYATAHGALVDAWQCAFMEAATLLSAMLAGEVASFAAGLDAPASSWVSIWAAPQPQSPAHHGVARFVEHARGRFAHVVDGAATVLFVPAHAAPPEVDSRLADVVKMAPLPDRFGETQVRECARMFSHLSGRFASRLAAAVALVD